jgi:hypothetical protein
VCFLDESIEQIGILGRICFGISIKGRLTERRLDLIVNCLCMRFWQLHLFHFHFMESLAGSSRSFTSRCRHRLFREKGFSALCIACVKPSRVIAQALFLSQCTHTHSV